MTSAYVPGIRERKKKEARNRLARAAVELTSLHGLETATIAAISERADVSSRTFHNYFPHRDAAIMHYLEYIVERDIEYLQSLPKGMHPVDVMRSVRENCHEKLFPEQACDHFSELESLFLDIRNSAQVDVQKECFRLLMRYAQALSQYTEGRLSPFNSYMFINASIATIKSAQVLNYFGREESLLEEFGMKVDDPQERALDILREGFPNY